MRLRTIVQILPAACLLSGCASLTVTNLNTNPNAKGVRYSLPQPILQAAPQADGTVSVDVFYMPDGDRSYAIDADSEASTYTYQISISQNGLLNAIEFKEDTSAVGQQLAASAGTAVAQTLNIKNAQLIAAQTAVTTAQTGVDTAQSATDAANAQLQADTDNGVAASLNADKAALAQAQAKLQDAQAILDRAKNTALAVSTTASAGTPVATTGPTPGTTGFGPQTWQAPNVYELPSNLGAVIYFIDDKINPVTKKETVSLKAQTFPDYPSKIGGAPIPAATQQTYPTTGLALGQPTLGPQGLTYQLAAGTVNFEFDRAVSSIYGSGVVGSDGKDTGSPIATLDPDFTTVFQDTSKLKAGSYILTVRFYDDQHKLRVSTVKFTLI